MVDLQYSSPLKWPVGRKQTPPAEKGTASGAPPALRIEEAVEYVKAELLQFPATEAILSSDYDNIHDTHLRAKAGSSSGVSLQIESEGGRYTITCDKYTSVQLNIYAIHLMLRHTLQMKKWGLGDIPVLLAGYRADSHSAQSTTNSLSGNEWWLQYLGLGPTARIGDANAVYRTRAKDSANNEEMLLRLNEAIALARSHLK